MNDRDRELFRGLSAPPAPDGLGHRVVIAARRAARARPATLDERLWRSLPLRLAWAACVIGLLAANLALLDGPAHRDAMGDRPRVESADVIELVATVGAPPTAARSVRRSSSTADTRKLLDQLYVNGFDTTQGDAS